MDGWWECERLDMFFQRVVSAGLEKKLPHHLKDTLRIAAAPDQSAIEKRAWIVGKEHYDLGNDLFTLMLDPCNIPAATGKTLLRWRKRRKPSCG